MPLFHNGFNYDYDIIKEELAEEFENQLTCLGENSEKYINFISPIEKEVTEIDVMCNHLVPPFCLFLCTPPQLRLPCYIILLPLHLCCL